MLSDDEKLAGAQVADALMTELMEQGLASDPHFAAVFSAAFVQTLLENGWRFERDEEGD